MPGWAAGNIVIGLIIGMTLKFIQKIKNKTVQVILTALVAIVASFIGIELIKSLIDSFVVSQPFVVRFAKNMTSFISDAFVIVISLPICALVEKPAKKFRYGDQ